jgi:hypothetical protein
MIDKVTAEDGAATAPATTPSTPKQKLARRGRPPAVSKAGGGGPRRFPAHTLEEALKIPLAIKNLNGGNPWTPKDVARGVGVGAGTPKFYYLTASSRDYGMTVGTQNTDEISVTDLGKRVVYPVSPEAEAKAIKEALFSVPVFKAVYDHYQGGKLPEIKYLGNTLETVFSIPPRLHEEFYRFYTANVAFLSKQKVAPPEGKIDRRTVDNSGPIVIAEPATGTKLKAFVIMPFSEKTDRYAKGFFDEVLKNLISPAAVEAGFSVETARRDGSDIIQSTIVNELMDADIVVVDLTEHNPNVLFELGLRIAFEKPIALIKAEGTAPIFDVDAMLRVASYNPVLWKSTLQTDVPKICNHIKGAWDSRNGSTTWLKLLKKAA